MRVNDLSLHILDIAENSVEAGARHIAINVSEDTVGDLLTIEIEDDGRGMEEEVLRRVMEAGTGDRTGWDAGMGLPLLKEACVQADGTLTVSSKPGAGTTVRATFQLGHHARKPLGSMADTIVALLCSGSEIDVRYVHRRDDTTMVFDSKEIRDDLGGTVFASAKAMNFIRGYLIQEEQLVR